MSNDKMQKKDSGISRRDFIKRSAAVSLAAPAIASRTSMKMPISLFLSPRRQGAKDVLYPIPSHLCVFAPLREISFLPFERIE